MNIDNKNDHYFEHGHELGDSVEDPFMGYLHKIIRGAVRVLATLMVLVIVWGIGDVLHVLYQRLIAPPFMLFGTAGVVLALGITYWLLGKKS